MSTVISYQDKSFFVVIIMQDLQSIPHLPLLDVLFYNFINKINYNCESVVYLKTRIKSNDIILSIIMIINAGAVILPQIKNGSRFI